MPLEGQQGIVAHHAAAIIGDLDEFLTAGFDLNFHSCGARVDGRQLCAAFERTAREQFGVEVRIEGVDDVLSLDAPVIVIAGGANSPDNASPRPMPTLKLTPHVCPRTSSTCETDDVPE